MQQHSIRDNKKRGSAAEFLRNSITEGSRLSFVSAYFTTHAYDALREKLDSIDSMRFLFGEPCFMTGEVDGKTPKSHILDPENLTLSKTLSQKKLSKDCHKWLDEKCEVRSMVKPNFLHGKAYHIRGANGVESAIIGSSNFTVNGLGLGKSPNIELNLVLNDSRDTGELVRWFEEIWSDEKLTVDVKKELLDYLQELYRDNSPSFVYFFTLYHLFNVDLAEMDDERYFDTATHILDTKIWQTLFDFQRDGAKEAIKKLGKYGGAILSDSVGLGKTFTALAVIKYFELKNLRILVLAPKRLEQNWKVYRENSSNNPLLSDRFGFDIYAHTDLDRQKFEHIYWHNYDLVVIDESHNFKNSGSSRYKFLMDKIIRSGGRTKVLLLSATPVNNSFKDLRNQISLIAGGTDSAFDEFGVGSIESAFKTAQMKLNEWMRDSKRDKSALIAKLGNELFSLLDSMTIARSRSHIKRFYDAIFKFPTRKKPLSVYAPFCVNEQFLTFTQIKKMVDGYSLAIFAPSNYVKNEHKSLYGIKASDTSLSDGTADWDDQGTREHYLVGMMRVNFLKRLESSIHSFRATLERTISKIDKAIAKIDAFSESETIDVEMDDDEEAFEFSKVSYKLSHLRLDEYKKELIADKHALSSLLETTKIITPDKDAKLVELKKLIAQKATQKNKKVLLFTAFADTAEYLYDSIGEYAQTLGLECALVTGSGRNDSSLGVRNFEAILNAFSPISKKATVAKEIDILIATDCVSEGQNLQDCDYLINYDIHWNPVRIIQRFGRIDRIGSQNETISMVNFWPTQELDDYLDLKDRVQTRMLLADLAATGSDNPLESDEAAESLIDWRARQIREIKEGSYDFDAEDEGGISLSDFSFDDLRLELRNFLDENAKKFDETPSGIYAVVGCERSKGAVFCLRATEQNGKNNANPLYPYFIVFVADDGSVRYGYKSVRESLNLLKSLCVGVDEPLSELCREFDRATRDGEDMSHYETLVKKAVQSISNTGLSTGRSGVIIAEAKFELVSFFVLK